MISNARQKVIKQFVAVVILLSLVVILPEEAQADSESSLVYFKGYSFTVGTPKGICSVSDETEIGEILLEKRQQELSADFDYPVKLMQIVHPCKRKRDKLSGLLSVGGDQYFKKGSDADKALEQKLAELSPDYGKVRKEFGIINLMRSAIDSLAIDLVADGFLANQKIPVGVMRVGDDAVITVDLHYAAGQRSQAIYKIELTAYSLVKSAMLRFVLSRKIGSRHAATMYNQMQLLRDELIRWVKITRHLNARSPYGD